MTRKQQIALWKKQRWEKKKATWAARRHRKAERKARRKAQREAKAAPKKSLAEWSLQVRAVGCCAVCGSTENINAHHLLERRYYPHLRTDPMNGICLCAAHHIGRYSAHKNGFWFTFWLRANRPEQYKWIKANIGGDSIGMHLGTERNTHGQAADTSVTS